MENKDYLVMREQIETLLHDIEELKKKIKWHETAGIIILIISLAHHA